MTKKITTAIMAMGLIGSALAQDKDYKNAPFVGVSIGSSKITRTFRAEYSVPRDFVEDELGNSDVGGYEIVGSNMEGSININESPSGAYFGIIGGYRYFVQPELAIRGYGELEYHPVRITDEDNEISSKFINLIVGADALYYFKQSDDFDIAAFAGLGLVFSRLDSNMLLESGKNATGIMLNVGVHADINERHGVDVGVKFFSSKVSESGGYNVNMGVSAYYDGHAEVKQNHALFARYTFSF